MWNWILQLFGFRSTLRDTRQLYRFYDGTRYRVVDPVEAWSAMEVAAGEEWTSLMRTMAADPPPGTVGAALKLWYETQQDAAKKVAAAVCAAFGVAELAETDAAPIGLTRAERIALAADFMSYMGSLAAGAKKKPIPSPSPTEASLPG